MLSLIKLSTLFGNNYSWHGNKESAFELCYTLHEGTKFSEKTTYSTAVKIFSDNLHRDSESDYYAPSSRSGAARSSHPHTRRGSNPSEAVQNSCRHIVGCREVATLSEEQKQTSNI